MTVAILIVAVFVLGFIADPIINLYFDPWSFLLPWSRSDPYYYKVDERPSWSEHFAKGFASMGVLGFLKVLIANPLSYRFGGGRTRNTGRDRYEQVSWVIILVGVGTFLMVCCSYVAFLMDLTSRRRPTKESEYGVGVRSKELVNESWTYKVRTTTTAKTSNILRHGYVRIRTSSTSFVFLLQIIPSVPVLGPHIFKLSWFLLCTEPISLRAKIKSLRSPIGLHVLCGQLGPLCYRLWYFIIGVARSSSATLWPR
jgi:hypothetical protein